MKTAISLPDQLFEVADSLASQMKVSRSQFYATALEKYIAEIERCSVTEKINKFIDEHGQEKDDVMDALMIAQMRKTEWK